MAFALETKREVDEKTPAPPRRYFLSFSFQPGGKGGKRDACFFCLFSSLFSSLFSACFVMPAKLS